MHSHTDVQGCFLESNVIAEAYYCYENGERMVKTENTPQVWFSGLNELFVSLHEKRPDAYREVLRWVDTGIIVSNFLLVQSQLGRPISRTAHAHFMKADRLEVPDPAHNHCHIKHTRTRSH